MDERQLQIRGKIMTQAVIGTIILLLVIAFLDSFGIIRIISIMEVSDLLLNIALLMLTYISINLIWRDAYFGLVDLKRMKMAMYVFIILAIVEDGLMIFHIFNKEGFSPISFLSIIMVNSIAISLICKRKVFQS